MGNVDSELQRGSTAIDDDEFDDWSSGLGLDDTHLLEFGESGEEICRVGDDTCSIPLELYDLWGLGDVLSVDVWNDCLSEEEQFKLTEYLPDMDQEMFMITLKELFEGHNFHFGSPIKKLFEMLKGGLCESRVALYQQGLNIFQNCLHYHSLRKHQNSMVTNCYQMKDAWVNCKGYSVDEKLRVLNIWKSQESLMCENMEESGEGLWSEKLKDWRYKQKKGHRSVYGASPTLEFPSQQRLKALEWAEFGMQNSKGKLKLAGSTISSKKKLEGHLPSVDNSLEMKPGGYNSALAHSKNDKVAWYDPTRISHGCGKRVKYPENDQQLVVEGQMKYVKGRPPNMSLKRDQIETSDGPDIFRHDIAQAEAFSVYSSSHSRDWSNRSKKLKRGKESSDIRVHSWSFSSDYSARPSYEDVKTISGQNGGQTMAAVKGIRTFSKREETESESFKQIYEDEDANPLMRSNFGYPNNLLESDQSTISREAKFLRKDKKDRAQALNGFSHYTRRIADPGKHFLLPKVQNYSSKAKQQGKMHYSDHLHNSAAKMCEENTFYQSDRLCGDDKRQLCKLGEYGQRQGQHREKFHIPSLKVYTSKRRKREEVGFGDFITPSNYSHDRIADEKNDSVEASQSDEEVGVSSRPGKKGRVTEEFMNDCHERFDVPILGCYSLANKRKVKEDVTYLDEGDDSDYQQLNGTTSLKKREKRKLKDESGSFEIGTSELPVTETGMSHVHLEFKPQKEPFTLITPSIHTGFSFSIIHLLSAVRMAMIALLPEDALEVGKHLDKIEGRERVRDEQDRKLEGNNGVHLRENLDVNNFGPSRHWNVPHLTVLEIVNRVRSNPGDPSILETEEPLEDLVRGVLNIFSSKMVPLGAKSWKALVLYEKSTKRWSWIGPVSSSLLDHEAFEEVTSPEAWGFPRKMLVKLVDSFANWLKSNQKTLQQIESLPSPPLTLMQSSMDEKERFRFLGSQKSLTTISPNSEEVRSYFHKEEILRYSIPEMAFSYTAVDGRKSTVAPLRSCGGKSISKVREHFVLKHDRPPHVTLLCVVRDAAARLPGSIGTRGDVCTLVRDSQYIVEDVSDAQLYQVISGALDRLHDERDPCVQYDGKKRLWVYLHGERGEEDFVEDGTSSTRKLKRKKKGSAEPFDQGALAVANYGAE